MKHIAALVCVLAATGCTKAKVEVNCQGQGSAVACTLTETKGTDQVKACFDLTYACKNGTTLKKHACEPISGGKTITRAYPSSGFSAGSAACDAVDPNSLGLGHLELN